MGCLTKFEIAQSNWKSRERLYVYGSKKLLTNFGRGWSLRAREDDVGGAVLS